MSYLRLPLQRVLGSAELWARAEEGKGNEMIYKGVGGRKRGERKKRGKEKEHLGGGRDDDLHSVVKNTSRKCGL